MATVGTVDILDVYKDALNSCKLTAYPEHIALDKAEALCSMAQVAMEEDEGGFYTQLDKLEEKWKQEIALRTSQVMTANHKFLSSIGNAYELSKETNAALFDMFTINRLTQAIEQIVGVSWIAENTPRFNMRSAPSVVSFISEVSERYADTLRDKRMHECGNVKAKFLSEEGIKLVPTGNEEEGIYARHIAELVTKNFIDAPEVERMLTRGLESDINMILLIAGEAVTDDNIRKLREGAYLYLMAPTIKKLPTINEDKIVVAPEPKNVPDAAESVPDAKDVQNVPDAKGVPDLEAHPPFLTESDALKIIYDTSGLKAQEMGELLGVSRSTVINLVKGVSRKTLKPEGKKALSERVCVTVTALQQAMTILLST